MSDILEKTEIEEETHLDDETTSQEESELDEVEGLASEIGWREGGELSAKDYILKSRDIQDTMRDHIKTQKTQITDLGSSVEALKIHNDRVYRAEIKQKDAEIKSLKADRKEAIEDGDVDKVDEIDERIYGLKEEMVEPPVEVPISEEFGDWEKNNKWYKENQEMHDYADSIADKNQGAPFKRVAALVESKVKEMFPDKFQTKSTLAPSPVEGSGKRIASAKFTRSDLTESQVQIMKQFSKQGIMTEKQYIADIGKTQGAI